MFEAEDDKRDSHPKEEAGAPRPSPDRALHPDDNPPAETDRAAMTWAIVYGSQTGNTALVAEATARHLRQAGIDAAVINGAEAAVADLAGLDRLLLLTSSHGNGELPDNLIALHEAIGRERPDLSQLAFMVFAIGDTTYAETFCFAGATMDRALAAAGARRIAPMAEIDVSVHIFAEEPVMEWLDSWLADSGER